MVCPPIRGIIQADKPWYNYYLYAITYILISLGLKRFYLDNFHLNNSVWKKNVSRERQRQEKRIKQNNIQLLTARSKIDYQIIQLFVRCSDC